MTPGRRELTAVFLGGVIGALARAGLFEAWPTTPGCWPWITLLINVAGSVVIAAAYSYYRVPAVERWFLGPGFCGALTTFSTMQLELFRMAQQDHWGLLFGYAATSLAAGVLAISLGKALGGGTWRVGAELPPA